MRHETQSPYSSGDGLDLTAGTWTVRAVAGPVPAGLAGVAVPATVPGCVHLDLLAAGLIADPYLDQNEAAAQWIGQVDWQYETTIDWAGADPGDHVDLVALGLDTIATVELNGSVVAQTANMHRSYRFPIAPLLRPGSNQLSITFGAAEPAAKAASVALGPRPSAYPRPYNALRKMAANFGWDWGPTLITAGIWRPLHLHVWRTARIAAVRPLVSVDGDNGLLDVHIDLQREPESAAAVSVSVEVAGQRTEVLLDTGEISPVISIRVPDVELWWPTGFGPQTRYPVTVQLLEADRRLGEWRGQVGFRSVRLDSTPDPDGTPFTLLVNDIPVFARGVNWIPDDCFPSRISRARYARRLEQAREANVNLVRVWGGGIYEAEDFYDLCDEMGLLVWQDFPFACAAYAEEDPLRSEVIAEAGEAITRLSSHPSLAVWNGGNENIWGHEDWGWKEELNGASWGWGYYTQVFPALLAELDPTRPYTPGSPFSPAVPQGAQHHPNDPAHGSVHIWDVWNERDYAEYRRYRPRFVAEFGFQGPPTWATLTRAIHDQPVAPDSPAMLAHQKADDGNGKLARGLHQHLPAPHSFEDWHWATSLNQARAIALGIEHFRSLSPLCMGTVLWQLNDCWPATSWAAIDGDGRAKPAWYALRRAYRDRLLTVQPRDGGLALVAVNDSNRPWDETVQISRRCLDGSVRAELTTLLRVPPRRAVTIALPAAVTLPDAPTEEFILADTGHTQAWWHFAEDVHTALAEADFEAGLEATPDGYLVTVTAKSFLRDLALLADRVAPDAVVDDMLVTVLPGQTVTFAVHTAATLTLRQMINPLVLRSANQLVAHPAAAGVLR